MALYIPHSIFYLARLLHVRPETFGPYYMRYCTLPVWFKTNLGHTLNSLKVNRILNTVIKSGETARNGVALKPLPSVRQTSGSNIGQ